MTLVFIGSVACPELPDVRESVERAAAGVGAFDLTALRLITLPLRGPSRLVALKTDAPPELLELQRRLAQRFSRSPQDRSMNGYLPHLTLARFDGGGSPGVCVSDDVKPLSFRVDHVVLMRSVMLMSGAEHREDMRVALQG